MHDRYFLKLLDVQLTCQLHVENHGSNRSWWVRLGQKSKNSQVLQYNSYIKMPPKDTHLKGGCFSCFGFLSSVSLSFSLLDSYFETENGPVV